MTARPTTLVTIAMFALAPSAGCDAGADGADGSDRSTASSGNASEPDAAPSTASAPPSLDGDDWLLYETSAATVAFVTLDGSTSAFPVIDAATVPSPQDNPDWSPDGKRITFVSRDGLWVMDADGSDATVLVPITAPSYVDDPSWSPDGETIAFSRTQIDGDRGTGTLETVAVADGALEVLAGPSRTTFSAGVTWSPDGERVAFESIHLPRPSLDTEPTGVDLALLTLRTREVVTVLDAARFPETADWSPDGRWIAVGYRPTPGVEAPDLYLLRPDGSDVRRVTTLTEGGGYATHPSFSADGASVVFAGARHDGDSDQLLRVGIDGGRPQPLDGGPVFGSHPKVRPAS
jgi:Tol biopolymer transport system component